MFYFSYFHFWFFFLFSIFYFRFLFLILFWLALSYLHKIALSTILSIHGSWSCLETGSRLSVRTQCGGMDKQIEAPMLPDGCDFEWLTCALGLIGIIELSDLELSVDERGRAGCVI